MAERHYRSGSHTKYDIRIHFVWIPKYRKAILTGIVGTAVRDVIRQICTQHDWEIVAGKVAPNHVHLFLSIPPHHAPSHVMQIVKGKSSYKMMAQFSYLQKMYWGRHMWARGYLAVSSGNITDEIIARYIQEQEGEDIHHGSITIKQESL